MKLLVLALILFFSACSRPSGERSDARADSGNVAESSGTMPQVRPRPALPEQRADTIMLEGNPEAISLKLYRSAGGFPLPFHTYYPSDMIVETTSAGEGDGVHFIANFGGVRNDNARLVYFVFPETVPAREAQKTIDRIVQEGKGNRRTDSRYEWVTGEYIFAGDSSGYLLSGTHEGRTFYWLARYPEEYSEGFVPRADLVIEHFEYE